MYQCIYTLYNETDDMLVSFNFQECASPLEGQVTADIPAGESHDFYGNDLRTKRIYNNLKAKVAFLGLEYGSGGVWLDIQIVPPTEIPEE